MAASQGPSSRRLGPGAEKRSTGLRSEKLNRSRVARSSTTPRSVGDWRGRLRGADRGREAEEVCFGLV
jgi:hypothetical protein